VQLATRLAIHPLIYAREKGVEFVEGLIDRIADVVVDYRKPSLVEDIRAALPEGQKLMPAPDAVSGKGRYGNICKVLSTDGRKLAMVLPPDPGEGKIPEGDYGEAETGGVAFIELKELEFAWSRLLGLGLKDGG
jgi:hypothetical protein